MNETLAYYFGALVGGLVGFWIGSAYAKMKQSRIRTLLSEDEQDG